MKYAFAVLIGVLGLFCPGNVGAENAGNAGPMSLWCQQPASVAGTWKGAERPDAHGKLRHEVTGEMQEHRRRV